MRSAASLFVSTVAAALALAPAASAEWLAPTTLAQLGTSSFPPAVTAGPDGSVTAMWPSIADSRIVFVAATRPAGGGWGQPVLLETPVSGTNALDLVTGPDGSATAAWIASTGGSQAVRAATRAPGGSWSAPQVLSDDARTAEQVSLASGPDGAVAAIWRRYDGGRPIVQARIRPAGGAWGPVANLSEPGQDASSPRIGLDGQGVAHAIWSRFNGSRTVVQTATKPAGGGWTAAQTLSNASFNAGYVQLAVSPAGAAVAAWTLGTSPTSVQAMTKSAGGAWSAVHNLSVAGRTATEPQVGINASGDATVVWGESDGSHQIARTATKPAGGSWSPSTALSVAGQSALALTFASTPDGAAAAGWIRYDSDGSYRVEAVQRPPGGSWSAPEQLSAPGRHAMYPQIAIDGRGNAVVAWDRATDADVSRHEIQVAGFDGEGPRLDGLSIPATATAGAPAAFSVSAFDVWSPAVSVTWSFGDGTTATGPSATHAFAAAGERQVTVTAVDAVGRQSTATRTVAVSPAPTGVGPGDGPGAGAALRATVRGSRQRIGQVRRTGALRATCALSAAGRCTVTATLPARTARGLGLRLPRGRKVYVLGSRTVKVTRADRAATLTIALDHRERAALGRARSLTVALKATATAGSAKGSAATRVKLRR